MTFQTLDYREENGVAWVTLNRPDVHNAFNLAMQRELSSVWRGLRRNDDIRVAVLTGAGTKAFCTGVDRTEMMGSTDPEVTGLTSTPFMYDDPGKLLSPKANDLWKPVIAAVNGMAAGGAFYLLGEVEFIIAAESATFFDPHVSFGMTAAYEPIHMLARMPIGEVMRMSLLGNRERMSAQRGYEVGLVQQVVPDAELHEAARWAAEAVAEAPTLAVQGTVRAVWAGKENALRQALGFGYAFVGMGTNAESLAEGQRTFASGKREPWRLR
jgi:enoyl-CoA hydratase/carnithine racemase